MKQKTQEEAIKAYPIVLQSNSNSLIARYKLTTLKRINPKFRIKPLQEDKEVTNHEFDTIFLLQSLYHYFDDYKQEYLRSQAEI